MLQKSSVTVLSSKVKRKLPMVRPLRPLFWEHQEIGRGVALDDHDAWFVPRTETRHKEVLVKRKWWVRKPRPSTCSKQNCFFIYKKMFFCTLF